nr:hypothetical protein [uncultured Acetatifactor sp.]
MRKKIWHCKSCGRVCDGSNTVCPDCGLDLGFYGEIQFVETGEPEPSSSSGFQTQEQAKPAAEEGSRPEIKEGHQDKERRPKTLRGHKNIDLRGRFLRLLGTLIFALEGFWGLRNFGWLRYISHSEGSTILPLIGIFITILLAVFFFLGKKKPLAGTLLIYSTCNILQLILILLNLHNLYGASAVLVLPYLMKVLSYFIILTMTIVFIRNKTNFLDRMKKFWWMPGAFICCADIFYMYSSGVLGIASQMPLSILGSYVCEATGLFLLGWRLTHDGQWGLGKAE